MLAGWRTQIWKCHFCTNVVGNLHISEHSQILQEIGQNCMGIPLPCCEKYTSEITQKSTSLRRIPPAWIYPTLFATIKGPLSTCHTSGKCDKPCLRAPKIYLVNTRNFLDCTWIVYKYVAGRWKHVFVDWWSLLCGINGVICVWIAALMSQRASVSRGTRTKHTWRMSRLVTTTTAGCTMKD